LPALQRISSGDVKRDPGRGDRAAADGDPAANQRAEHRKEAAVRILDRRRVHAVPRDVPVLIQQVVPRDPHVIEDDAAVVDSGESALVVAVRRGNTGHVVAVRVADRDQEAVHAVALRFLTRAGRDELRENGRHGGRFGSAADVVLARARGRRVDDELVRGVVIRGHCLQRLDVVAMAGLRHREAAEQIHVDNPADIRLVVPLGAEVFDRAAEQSPLHAGLDHQRQVRHRQHLDRCDGRADVTGAAVFLPEAVLRPPKRRR
jgi:hypothetical protein